jgi:hypothetical protein
MKSSIFVSALLSKAVKQNENFKECNLMNIAIVLPASLVFIVDWTNCPIATFFSITQSAYGIAADYGLSVPKAFSIYGNQKYEMIPFVSFDGKNMNKIIYPSADVTPELTAQEGGNASITFNENSCRYKCVYCGL